MFRSKVKTAFFRFVGLVLCLLLLTQLLPATEVEATATASSAFEKHLTQQRFPESYKSLLRQLHQVHPDWIFTAFHVEDSWPEVQAAQARAGLNQIWYERPIRNRSYRPGDYNYRNDTWTYYDARFIAANLETIAHTMDPRNFLNEVSIFQFENLKYNKAIHSRDGVASILTGTFMQDGNAFDYVDADGKTAQMMYPDAFIAAAEYSGVSPYHLASRVLMEVGAQGSGSVSGNYVSKILYPNEDLTGLYNFYNIGASASTEPVARGLMYAKYGASRKPNSLSEEDVKRMIPWTDRYRSLVGGSRFIGQNYINANQHTLYLQKFDLDSEFFGKHWHQYMGNVHAPSQEAVRVHRAYKNSGTLSSPLEFILPVFREMPAKASPEPTDDRSRNNYLRSITATDGNFATAFNPEKDTFTLLFPRHVKSTTLTATAYHGKATIQGTGSVELADNDVTHTIVCRSERGDLRKYKLILHRTDAVGGDPTPTPTPTSAPTPTPAPTAPPATPALTSSVYKISDGTITGLDPQKQLNTVEALRANLQLSSGHTLEIQNADGTALTEGVIGTGSKLVLLQAGKPVKTYTAVIYGDADGDGMITVIDITVILNDILQVHPLTDAWLQAADTDADGIVSVIDITVTLNQILEVGDIPQTR